MFLILMLCPVFPIKSSALFLDGTIYMEFLALCQVNIGNKKKEVSETLIKLNISVNIAPKYRNCTFFLKNLL
jgi:hypothetical protein